TAARPESMGTPPATPRMAATAQGRGLARKDATPATTRTIGHQTPQPSPESIRFALPRSRITPTPRMIPPKKTRPQFMFPTVLGTRYSVPGKSQEKEEAPAEPGPFEVPGTRYGVGRRPARSVLDVEGADGAAPLGDGGLVLHQLGEVAGDLDLAGHESHLGVHLALGDGGGGVVGLLDGHIGRF